MFSFNIIVIVSTLVCLGQSDTIANLCFGRDNVRRLAADPNNPKVFHVCLDGKEVGLQTCPFDTVFSEQYQTCVNDVHNKDSRCLHYAGQYADPQDKHKFIVCVQGRAMLFTCPANLVFNERAGVCVWEYQDHLF